MKKKIAFLINGSTSSAAATRARAFAQHFSPNWDTSFHYRSLPKWRSTFSLLQRALSLNPDIIYVVDSAFSGVLAGALARRTLRCKLIVDTGDACYELAKSSGKYSWLQLNAIKWIEKLAIQQSDCLVVRGSYHKEWLIREGLQGERIEFVPDGVHCNNICLSDSADLKRKLGLEHNLIVGLVGTMSWSKQHHMCYGWDIVEALAFLKGHPIKALLVGDGDGREILEKRVQELGLQDKILFTGQLPYEELSEYILVMDVCISTQSNNLVGMVRTTGKLPLYLAHGKYVIATNVGEARKVLPSVGHLLPYEGIRDEQYPYRLASHFIELIENPSLLKVVEQATSVAKEKFDYPKLATQVESLCEDLLVGV